MPLSNIPSRRELTAAYWTGRVLATDGLPFSDLRTSYRSLPLGGRLDFADLYMAETTLHEVGLLRENNGWVAPSSILQTICSLHEEAALEPLLAAMLEREPPLWLLAATGGTDLRDELIPEQASRELERLFADPGRREAFLLARGRKVEGDERAALGDLGEQAVVAAAIQQLTALGRLDLADRVHQVSKVSDELGYDVTAPRLDGLIRRMEVKTTRIAATAVTIFLSRNEARVGLADPHWSLVVCELSADGSPAVVGWHSAANLAELLPHDRHSDGAWESARLSLVTSTLVPGLPPAE